MKKSIASNAHLKQKLLSAFKRHRKPLADKLQPSKLMNVVSNIAVRRLLYRALNVRKEAVGNLLHCIKPANDLKISSDNFGDSWHHAYRITTQRLKQWRCTCECKPITQEKVQKIKAIKALFSKPVYMFRQGLSSIV